MITTLTMGTPLDALVMNCTSKLHFCFGMLPNNSLELAPSANNELLTCAEHKSHHKSARDWRDLRIFVHKSQSLQVMT